VKGRRDPIATTPVERARALRRTSAAAERTAWRLLRKRRLLGLKFRRQHVIGRFVVDFYCAELRGFLRLMDRCIMGSSRLSTALPELPGWKLETFKSCA